MSAKGLLTGVGLLIAIILTITFPGAGYAQEGTGGNFILVNYIGQSINLDLDDMTYTVPGTDTNPDGGRFEMQLGPGEHKYAVNAPNVGGSAGEFTIEPGSTVAKGVRIEKGQPVLDRNGVVLEKPKDEVLVFDIDLTVGPVADTAPVDAWQPVAPTAGQASIVWINYNGVDELTVDLAGQLYKVPPYTNGIPGRLQIDLPAGSYTYTASVPFGSISGEIDLQVGQVSGVNVIPEIREAPKYKVGEKVDYPPVKLNIYQEDLTDQVSAAEPAAVPPALPPTGDEAAPSETPTAAQVEGVTVKNFTGDTLIFTINEQAYPIPTHSEQVIELPAGSYNYTASLPFVATTGTVDLTQTPGVALSVAINIAGDVLSVYQN